MVDLLMGLMQNRQVASAGGTISHLGAPALLQELATKHFTRLKKTCCTAPLPWMLGQVGGGAGGWYGRVVTRESAETSERVGPVTYRITY